MALGDWLPLVTLSDLPSTAKLQQALGCRNGTAPGSERRGVGRKRRSPAQLRTPRLSAPGVANSTTRKLRIAMFLESWDAAEDSEVEREEGKEGRRSQGPRRKQKQLPNKKSKSQRIAERQVRTCSGSGQRLDDEDSEEETEAQARERLPLASAAGRKATTAGSAVPIDASDPSKTVDLSALPLFKPGTKLQFEQLRNVLGPILSGSSKKAHYTLFLQEFTKQLAKELPSDQIKKIASTLTALSNEKMKEEKAADKGGKKSKAAKTKTSLAGVSRGGGMADTAAYDDDDAGFGEGEQVIASPVVPRSAATITPTGKPCAGPARDLAYSLSSHG
ncbi:hypothetical protein CHGG_04915 [Chaetomium globosum CBS 148.51]|uniref:Eukaryotic translation initiation factor 3 30 kDa subunit n=1 Tax=Chaetomium globosum (strain ATCC 6205 / CBS 148.51 / DSM 1962 / NBRC 6347 / NRRL 1970) TaxID=306901 RepID=Q2GZY1_CHAGB|nr:uncharacterized protein CHGG_04915 [Chaetomium globosum CBS 148.51]EAQ88296.1 hypothetical protein CHGG_04915 [Chaetomium globosum CBS 148.51]